MDEINWFKLPLVLYRSAISRASRNRSSLEYGSTFLIFFLNFLVKAELGF